MAYKYSLRLWVFAFSALKFGALQTQRPKGAKEEKEGAKEALFYPLLLSRVLAPGF